MSSSASSLVLYGSETGNALDAAEDVAAMARRLRFAVQLRPMDDVAADSLSGHAWVVFVVSTTGQGDLPLNARALWRALLRRRLPASFLAGVRFAVLGLGDSSYQRFNWAARKLHKRLRQLGADELYPLGEADQQHPEGLEATLVPWTAGLRSRLLELLPLGQTPIPDDEQLPAAWLLGLSGPADASRRADRRQPTDEPDEPDDLDEPDEPDEPASRQDGFFTATLVQNKRLTPADHWQDVRHICLTTPAAVPYQPGDLVAITPKSFAEDVQTLIDRMGWQQQADQLVELVPAAGAGAAGAAAARPIPAGRQTLRSLLRNYIDVRAVPRRSFFAAIAHYASDELHRLRLRELASPAALDDFWDYATRPRRSVLEVLLEFHSVRIPWQHLVAVLPPLRPRQFSIASGGELRAAPAAGTRLDLLVAIVTYQTVIRRIRRGVCTRYLAALRPGSRLRIQLQRGALGAAMLQPGCPLVLVGPGTGVAPLRALLWERARQISARPDKTHKTHKTDNPDAAASVLVFGGRNRAADFFFQDEWTRLAQAMPLRVLTAFSRDPPPPPLQLQLQLQLQQRRVYVQDAIRQQAALIGGLLLDHGAAVYVCGSSGRMPAAVRQALVDAVVAVQLDRQVDPEQARQAAEAWLAEMDRTGRYKQETW